MHQSIFFQKAIGWLLGTMLERVTLRSVTSKLIYTVRNRFRYALSVAALELAVRTSQSALFYLLVQQERVHMFKLFARDIVIKYVYYLTFNHHSLVVCCC